MASEYLAEGAASVAERYIIAPPPTTPSRCVVALHELGHVQMHRSDLPQRRKETRASRWAMMLWREAEFPDYAQASYALGSRLLSYAEPALRDGRATTEEIRAALDTDECLAPYPLLLGLEASYGAPTKPDPMGDIVAWGPLR